MRWALQRLTGLLPPKDLAPWDGLTSFADLDDYYATYAEVANWVGQNAYAVKWFPNGAVVDAAQLLVYRALECGTLREFNEYVYIQIQWSGNPGEIQDCLEVTLRYVEGEEGADFKVPPASVEAVLSECVEADLEAFHADRLPQHCQMNTIHWQQWVAAFTEPDLDKFIDTIPDWD